METKIKYRLKKGWNLTKKQIEWVKERIDPRYDQTCGHCRFNLDAYFDVLPKEYRVFEKKALKVYGQVFSRRLSERS